MKTKIYEAIKNINNSINYAENNTYYLDCYYDDLGYLFTYNSKRVTKVVKKFIEDNSSITITQFEELNVNFISDFIDTIFNMGLFKLTRNSDAYGCLYDLDLFGITVGEEEIQIFDNCEPINNNWIKNYIEHKTDTYIIDEYAYIVLFSSITVSLIKQDCIDTLNDMIEELQSEKSD